MKPIKFFRHKLSTFTWNISRYTTWDLERLKDQHTILKQGERNNLNLATSTLFTSVVYSKNLATFSIKSSITW